MNLPPTRSAISSPVSGDGPSLLREQEYPAALKFGLDPARASLSAKQAKAEGVLTSGTYGRHSSTSSMSAVLRSCLENRLRVRLAGCGSTLFKMTWKVWVTPSGRLICALRASAPRTSGSACIGWPTPVVNDSKGSDYTYNQGRHNSVSLKLGGAAKLAGWPTPMAGTPAQNGYNEAGNNDSSRKTVALASWATPTTRDHKDGASVGTAPVNCLLGRQAWLADSGKSAEWIYCTDDKWRPVEPGSFPLAHGVPGRVGLLRGYGNAIVPQVAQAFIESYLEAAA